MMLLSSDTTAYLIYIYIVHGDQGNGDHDTTCGQEPLDFVVVEPMVRL